MKYQLQVWSGSSVGAKGGRFCRLATSKNISYLKRVMKENRRYKCCSGCGVYKDEYRIIDENGLTVFSKVYEENERVYN